MKQVSLLTFVAMCFTMNTFGQENLRKFICDSQTRKGIPFAKIKVLNKAEGTYANDKGLFIVKALKNDSLLIACVGYIPEKLILTVADTVFLQPIVITLPEVKIIALKRKEYSIGYHNMKKKLNLAGGRLQIEFATKLIIPDEYISYRIKKVKIKNGNRNEANPVRLHIYSEGKDGLPEKELLTEDIIINNCIKANDNIDLSKLDMVLSERVLFVGIEWIDPVIDRKMDIFKSIRFGFTNQIPENHTYFRTFKDPEYRWKLLEKFFPDKNVNLMVSLIID